jgi:hypothetical protein
LCFANLIDRPFVQHIVEFLAEQGIGNILIAGPEVQRARDLFGNGEAWSVRIEYGETPAALIGGRDTELLIATATSLPRFSVPVFPEGIAKPILVYGPDGASRTGWAIVPGGNLSGTQPNDLTDHIALRAVSEIRCGNAEELWKAHRSLQRSNLGGIFHGGLEVKPGIWIGRNASVAADVQITAPAFIGENSRIGAGARIGPFAAIGRDCLISPKTIVRDAVIAPRTYTGDNLELDHVLVNQRQLFDIRLGVSIDRVDASILDSVFDFHWSAIARRLFARLVRRSRTPVALAGSYGTGIQQTPQSESGSDTSRSSSVAA